MSTISMDIPTLTASDNDLEHLVRFVYKHEQVLKEFGAIKIQPNTGCKLALKKRPKNLASRPTFEQLMKIGENESIYVVRKVEHSDAVPQQSPLVTDEISFWSSLSCSSNGRRLLNSSMLFNKSFFTQKTARTHFDIHRIPKQSLLRLGGSKVTCQFVPCVKRAHGPGAIFPLTCAQQRLFSIDYHHEGGARHWYIIPSRERDALQRIIDQHDSSICLDHGQLLIDPTVLDKNHIRYHRIVQSPNEFVVLSTGALAQSFTVDASWSESIAFALPSWIKEGYTSIDASKCQCNIPHGSLSKPINIALFRDELIQKYVVSHLNTMVDDKSKALKDGIDMNKVMVSTSSNVETVSSNGI